MMKAIKFKCRIITPLFMGGANQQPELRTQSFNGLFRYWFRLLGGSFEDEKRLFGWGGDNARKGLVQINLESLQQMSVSGFNLRGQGVRYLGFSLILTGRRGISNTSNNNFKISFRFYPTTANDDIKKFLCSVWCAFYLGNFGSRSRRGFGSIVVENVEGDTLGLKFKPDNTSIEDWLKEQLNYIKRLNYWQLREGIPYIFENMEIYRFRDSKNDFISILNELGEGYRNFRKGKNIKDRIWLGLPIGNYIPKIDNKRGRRASPLIFKIIAFNDNFEGFIIVFKPNNRHNFKFLPQGATINLRGVNLNQPEWKAIDEFLQTLQNQNLLRRFWP